MNELISILTPLYNTDATYLNQFIMSIENQTYKNWELCLVNDCSNNQGTLNVLNHITNNKIKVINLTTNKGISIATEEAFSISTGDYICFADSDDVLLPEALGRSIRELKEHEAGIVYSDETLINSDGSLSGIHYKPDFAPDTLLSYNYMCHFVMLKRDIYIKAGGMRMGFDGSQDHDSLLRATEVSNKVIHIPDTLYYWRMVESSITTHSSTKQDTWDRGRRAIKEALERRGILGVVEPGPVFGMYKIKRDIIGNPLVSIVIPFKSGINTLRECVSSIIKNTTYNNYEIIIINSSNDTLKSIRNIKICEYKESFNYSKILNNGINSSNGDYIVTLHDDVTIVSNNWIESLLEHAQREEVGVVGSKSYYKNNTLYHAGIVIGMMGIAGNLFRGVSVNDPGYYNWIRMIRNVSAVSDTCMMFKKSLFNELNGFDENLVIDFNDIDFCLRARNLNLLNIYTPYCESFHEGLKTKGITLSDINSKKANDISYIKGKHHEIFNEGDPYYNCNLSLNTEKISFDFSNTIKNVKKINKEKILYQEVINKNSDALISNSDFLVTIIAPMYNCYPTIVSAMLAQTHKNFELLLIHDGPIPEDVLKILDSFNDGRVKILNTEKHHNDWGHTPREFGVTKISKQSNFVVFTGADNYYVPHFLTNMVNHFINDKIIATYCDCLHNYWEWTVFQTALIYGKIDCGCVMLRSNIAIEFGWKYREHAADWMFLQDIIRKYGHSAFKKVPKILFIHN